MISGLSNSSHAKTLIMTVQVAVGKAVHHAIATGDPAVLEKMPSVQRGLFSRKTPAEHIFNGGLLGFYGGLIGSNGNFNGMFQTTNQIS